MPYKPAREGVRSWKANEGCFEYHDREYLKNTSRRIVFKKGTNLTKDKNNFHLGDAAKYMLDDNAEDCIIITARGRQAHHRKEKGTTGGRGGRPSAPASRPRTSTSFTPGALPWYKIKIPYGAKHDKEVILKALLSRLTPEEFVPRYYKTQGNAALFYVDDDKIAEKLFHSDKKIVMSDGYKLTVIVRNEYPNEKMDDKLKEKMKLVMAKRYNANNKALDLTKFHDDPDLTDVFCALCRPLVMLAAIDIMAENIPDLEALNLNDNKLNGLNHLSRLCRMFKKLKILYMANNKITHMESLDPLKPLPLEELYLKGNPFVNKLNKDIYISDVRGKFPKVIKLDGEELPLFTGFEESQDVILSPPQPPLIVDAAGESVVRNFLKQYYHIYDSESREPLLGAYHEHATISMNSKREPEQIHHKTGRLQIVSFLVDLPKTTHDLIGSAVEFSVFTESTIKLTIHGVYKETNNPCSGNISFRRTFVIVPNCDGGLCIMSDALVVKTLDITKDQEDKSLVALTTALTLAPTPTVSEQQATLLDMLGQETRMNEEWCMQCLGATSWNIQQALAIFSQLNAEGKIPPEAFIR